MTIINLTVTIINLMITIISLAVFSYIDLKHFINSSIEHLINLLKSLINHANKRFIKPLLTSKPRILWIRHYNKTLIMQRRIIMTISNKNIMTMITKASPILITTQNRISTSLTFRVLYIFVTFAIKALGLKTNYFVISKVNVDRSSLS